MALISFAELFDIALMSLIVGFIFKDVFRTPKRYDDPDALIKDVTPGFSTSRISDYWFAVLIVAPAIIFHEFGHKFVAMSFGLSATFEAAYLWLGIGVIMKIVLPGFVFFVPAFTSISGAATPLQDAAISFAGPAINGLFWLCCFIYLRMLPKRRAKRDTLQFVVLFKRINGFLFIFNLIPIPGFDGYHFFSALYQAFF